jgi:hypothetical protein
LETKFGGNLRIEEDECWPPRIYGSDFESKVGRKMLTEEEYRLKYENGELKSLRAICKSSSLSDRTKDLHANRRQERGECRVRAVSSSTGSVKGQAAKDKFN